MNRRSVAPRLRLRNRRRTTLTGGIVSGAVLGAGTLLGPGIMIAMIVALCIARLRTSNDLAASVADVISSWAAVIRARLTGTTVIA